MINGRFLGQPTTGVQRVSREILVALNAMVGEGRDPDLTVRCVVEHDRARAAAEALACSHIEFEVARGGRGHLWEQWTLPRHLRGGRLLCLGNSAPASTLLSRLPPAVMLHDQAHLLYPSDYSASYRLFHAAIEALIVRRAAPLLLVSEAERASFVARHPRSATHLVVAPNGNCFSVDEPVDRRATDVCGAAESRRYGLFIGTASSRKNIDGVIATAIRLAREIGLPFRFVGPQAERLRAAVPADLHDLISFSSHVTDSELPGLYRNAAFLLYPSFYEASGLPPSEAMTFGCPVIASDLAVMHERCGDAALYCDPYQIDTIYQAAVRIVSDASLRAALSERSRRRAQRFTWRQQAETIVAAMRRLDLD